MVCVDVPVVQFKVPQAVSRLVHEVFLSLTEPPDLAPAQVMRPPPLKKYLMALADEKVMVWVAVNNEFQDEENVATPPAVVVVPTPTALLRLVNTLLRLVEKLFLKSMVSPTVGLVTAVTVVLVWLADEVNLENKVAQCVAVTVAAADTGVIVVV